MTPDVADEGSSPPDASSGTMDCECADAAPSIAPEASTTTSDDGDCTTAIEMPSSHFVPTLTLLALRALRGVIDEQLAKGKLHLSLPHFFAVVIETGERALTPPVKSADKFEEFAAVTECLALMFREQRMNDAQWNAFDSLLVMAHIATLPLIPNNGEYDDQVIRTLRALEIVSTRVLRKHYDAMVPLLISIAQQKRSQPLRIAAFHAIVRFGDAVRMSRFRVHFIETFSSFVDGNLKQIMDYKVHNVFLFKALTSCLGCVDNKANVVIRKVCGSHRCTNCACPPVWCVECLARSFLESAPSVDREAACPTCRAKYCVKDVAFVSYEKSED